MSGWRYPRVIAHRCGGALSPENTLAGLRMAAQLGLRATEFDVMLSADAVPILIHDETLERTTDGTGEVSRTSFADIRRLDAGVRFHRAFAGEPIPTLLDALTACRELGLWPNVEVKPAAGFEAETARAVARALRSVWPQGVQPPLLSSFSQTSLETLVAEAPEFPRALLVEAIPPDWRQRAERLGCMALHAAARTLRPEEVVPIRSAGLRLAAYTVNDPMIGRSLWNSGVDAVFTDRLDLFAGELDGPTGD